ncbi:MAG: hypothetical protein ACE5JB_14855 [bacterium]
MPKSTCCIRQFKTVFPWTPDGKINLASPVLGERPYEHLEDKKNGYLLALISPAKDKTISSTLGEFNLPELSRYDKFRCGWNLLQQRSC